jgi:hypothetical protein
MDLTHIVVDLLLAIASTYGAIMVIGAAGYGVYRGIKALARPLRRQLKHLSHDLLRHQT